MSERYDRKRKDWHDCDHKNANKTYDDADGVIYRCPECDCLLDENFEVVREPTDEIPF